MRRIVEPEWLDALPGHDPRAVGSRRDLRWLNYMMGHVGILTRAVRQHRGYLPTTSKPFRAVDVGAGNGTLSLELARQWPASGAPVQLFLLDRQNIVSTETQRALTALHWSPEPVTSDVFAWLENGSPFVDLMFANLFLHHFEEDALRNLFQLAAVKTKLFIACEPRRSTLALTASRLLGLCGCNDVTRHDAPASVRAGFVNGELSALWPSHGGWQLSEQAAGLFSHCFVAKRHE